MRLTLIYPSVGRKENTPYVRAWQMQPLSMALLAGLTPPDVEVRFYDDRMEEIPFDEPTDLVAMSVETFTALRAYKIARQFQARGVPVVMGGYHVTLLPDEAAREADAIVIGDAEPVWPQVLEDARNGGLAAGLRRPRPADADQRAEPRVRFSRASRTRTSRWWSSPAAATSSATSARSPRSTAPTRTIGRPARWPPRWRRPAASASSSWTTTSSASRPRCASCAAN